MKSTWELSPQLGRCSGCILATPLLLSPRVPIKAALRSQLLMYPTHHNWPLGQPLKLQGADCDFGLRLAVGKALLEGARYPMPHRRPTRVPSDSAATRHPQPATHQAFCVPSRRPAVMLPAIMLPAIMLPSATARVGELALTPTSVMLFSYQPQKRSAGVPHQPQPTRKQKLAVSSYQ